MYHSGVNEIDTLTIGRASDCGLVFDHSSVSRRHATASVTKEGFLKVRDENSSNGTWLHRNGRWVRARQVILGTLDRIRFGDLEVPLEQLVEAFGKRSPVRLREGFSVRGKPLVFDGFNGQMARPREVLENPRRNPVTGNIEEYKKTPGSG